jgi:hypothetical protein
VEPRGDNVRMESHKFDGHIHSGVEQILKFLL